jgi:16S rRNA (uracil1498-N3)-methyltransferase
MNALPVLYAPPERITAETVILPSKEAHHAVKVLRLRTGAMVMIIDGLGSGYRGTVEKVKRSGEVEVAIHSHVRNWGEPAVRLTLAAGLSLGDKFDSIVQRGTEIGVMRFVPLLTSLSRVKIEEPKRARSRVTRLERVALAAIKQCRRSYRPEISQPVKLSEFLKETDESAVNLLFHPAEHARSLGNIEFPTEVRRVTALVGPESGFDEAEVEQAVAAGFDVIGMGDRILRTETAGSVISALLMEKLGEFR